MTTGRAHTRTLATDPLGGTVRRTVLPNGLRLITEAIPAMRSVSFGVWVGVGSRDETPALSGASHFLEHLLFKGTERRTALDITAEEYTCYYARVLDADLPLAVDVVCDLVTDSILAEADVETERGVILEEIAMHDDEPGDEVHDLFAGAVYAGHPLARQVSGTVETISAMTRRQIQSFYGKRYTAPSIVVAAAGNLDHAKAVKLVKAAFERAGRFAAPGQLVAHRPAVPPIPVRGGQLVVRAKDTEQAHIVLGG